MSLVEWSAMIEGRCGPLVGAGPLIRDELSALLRAYPDFGET